LGVGQPLGDPVEPLADVRRADAVCAQNDSPDGVARRFQACSNSIEPGGIDARRIAPRALPSALLSDDGGGSDLLAEDDGRAAGPDEPEELRPEVPLVGVTLSLAGGREGLAGTTPSPDGQVVGPSGEAQGEFPASDAGEEVGSVMSHKVGWLDIGDAPGVDGSSGQQVAQPLGGVGIEFIEVGHRLNSWMTSSAIRRRSGRRLQC
jgi:hypothetical protein